MLRAGTRTWTSRESTSKLWLSVLRLTRTTAVGRPAASSSRRGEKDMSFRVTVVTASAGASRPPPVRGAPATAPATTTMPSQSEAAAKTAAVSPDHQPAGRMRPPASRAATTPKPAARSPTTR